jgi:hypothetical protein
MFLDNLNGTFNVSFDFAVAVMSSIVPSLRIVSQSFDDTAMPEWQMVSNNKKHNIFLKSLRLSGTEKGRFVL